MDGDRTRGGANVIGIVVRLDVGLEAAGEDGDDRKPQRVV